MQDPEITGPTSPVISLIEKVWLPFLGFLMVLMTAAVELRLRKLVEARTEKMEEKVVSDVLEKLETRLLKACREESDEIITEARYEIEKIIRQEIEALRRDIQIPIGNIGMDNLRTEKRLVELETKTEVFWNMFTRQAAKIMKAEDDR